MLFRSATLTPKRADQDAYLCCKLFPAAQANNAEDIKASFKHGVLNLTIAKKETPKLPEKKTIAIGLMFFFVVSHYFAIMGSIDEVK